MRKFLFLLLLFLLSVNALSQDSKLSSRHSIDSLLNLLPGLAIEKRIEILNELASSFAPTNFDSSIMFSTQAMRLATQDGNQRQIGIARYNIGNAYYYRLDFKNALLAYLSAQPIFENRHNYDELGDLYVMFGHMNFFITRGEKATSYYLKAISCYKESGNAESLDNTYGLMAMTIYFLGGQPIDSALSYAYKTLEYARKIKDPHREAHMLMTIGMIYGMEDVSLSKKQKFLAYNDTALKMVTAFNDEERMCIIHVNTGDYYDEGYPRTKDPELSKSHYLKGLELARKTDNNYMQSLCLNRLSCYDIEEGKYEQAKIRLDSSEARLNEFFKLQTINAPGYIYDPFGKVFTYYLSKREKTYLYQNRFKLAMKKGDFRNAVEYLQLYYNTRDSISASQQGKQFELLIAEDEAERQAQKIRTLAQDNELNQLKLSRSRSIFIMTGTGLVLISIILLLFFQRKRLRADQRSVSMEQRLLRAQMNPHFIFNSLASIQNFVINENSDQASIYLARFSQLVRNILDNSTEEFVPLEKEISTIENYLVLQSVRYAGKFDYHITVDETIDQDNMLIPPMLAQPFIENAIEHGIRHKETPGHIGVRFQLRDGFIRVEVEDDGVGRNKAQEIESKQKIGHRSMAISITRDRLDLLNKKLKKKIRMEIVDLKDDSGNACGTRVEFGIPVKGV